MIHNIKDQIPCDCEQKSYGPIIITHAYFFFVFQGNNLLIDKTRPHEYKLEMHNVKEKKHCLYPGHQQGEAYERTNMKNATQVIPRATNGEKLAPEDKSGV